MYIMVFMMLMREKEIELLERKIRREFRDCMPKRYYIFPTAPYIYSLSNSICIAMPRYGSIAYKTKLNLLKKSLNEKFIMDIQYDNKITFILKGKK